MSPPPNDRSPDTPASGDLSSPDRRPPADKPETRKPETRQQPATDERSTAARERHALMQLSSAGFELASFALILGGVGYGIDHWLGNHVTPYFAIAGILLGFSLGFYRLIVLASKMN